MARVMLRRPGRSCGYAGLLTLVLLVCLTARAAQGAETIEKQRSEFLRAYAAAKMGDASWRSWADDLSGYPLYPWLEATQLEHDLDSASPEAIARYLGNYAGLIPARDLRRHYLHLLAQRHRWRTYLEFYRPGLGDTLHCYQLRARLAQGQSLEFERDLSGLWREPSLPKPCNKVQVWAHEHGLLTPERLWQRIDSAADARRAGTIRWLARWLPHDQAEVARRYAEALRRPAHTVRVALNWSDTGRNREAAMLAITELARSSSARAVDEWPRLAKHFKFSGQARDRILRTLALFRAYGFHDDAYDLLSALPDSAENNATRAWRIRVALADRNWRAVLASLDALPEAQANDGSWRYLRARVLQMLGQNKKARPLFEQLSKEPDYWGFLAADRLGAPYVICPHRVHYSLVAEQKLLTHPDYARAFELFAVGMLRDARRQWARASKQSDVRTQNLAADLAFRRGWYSRAIFTYSYGDLLHHYRKRFPITRQALVSEAAQKTDIDPAWIYATIRAESAWIPDAGSGAGALGLMQLMPATARHVARRRDASVQGFSYEPAVNIRIGSYYLDYLAGRYGGRLWLASIAYNAGPRRADRWLGERDALPPDLFIMTIPFTQTRNYVIAVLAYSVIYDWQLHGKPTSIAWRLSGKADKRDDRVRKTVVCPEPATATQATSAATR